MSIEDLTILSKNTTWWKKCFVQFLILLELKEDGKEFKRRYQRVNEYTELPNSLQIEMIHHNQYTVVNVSIKIFEYLITHDYSNFKDAVFNYALDNHDWVGFYYRRYNYKVYSSHYNGYTCWFFRVETIYHRLFSVKLTHEELMNLIE